jgi:dimethylsulfone monooxygenase
MAAPHNRMFNANKLKLGIFSPNCSGGMAITKVPERWDASWESNLKLAKMTDDAGIEFLLPIARWIGYGGETDFQGHVMETITWCTGLLCATKGISVFATTHTAFFHPIVAAKQFATISHISDGRFGLNVVCGWNKPEYDMFNIQMPNEHHVRYALGQGWLDIIRRMWSGQGEFDWAGDFYNLKAVHGDPQPKYGTPPILNAGASKEGKDFAIKNVDFLFTTLIDVDSGAKTVSDVRAQAMAKGRQNMGVLTNTYVVCRPTRKEAEDYHDYYTGPMADDVAVDRLMELQGLHAQSFPPESFKLFRKRFAGGHGVYPLIGTPDDIAAELKRISDAGFDGLTLAFVNYVDEFPYFRDEVLPRLERMGLRQPFKG